MDESDKVRSDWGREYGREDEGLSGKGKSILGIDRDDWSNSGGSSDSRWHLELALVDVLFVRNEKTGIKWIKQHE
jgi:hypothetical protein